MLSFKVNITNKNFRLCEDVDYKFNNICVVTWGDGVISTVSNMKDMKHKYKKLGEYDIVVTNLDTDMIRFKGCKDLIEVKGKLPALGLDGIIDMFYGCENLVQVDPLYFINNKFQRNASNLCKDCYRLKDITFIFPLSEVEIIDSFLENCQSVSNLNDISAYKWGYKIKSANRAFKGIKFSHAPDKDILTAMKDLEYANGIFEDWLMMNECYTYFMYNLNIKRIDSAFKGSIIHRIDPNWFYYLPNSVETNRSDIFDDSVNKKLNGI